MPPKKTRIRDSKKAIFLGFAMIQLNIILAAQIWGGIKTEDYLSTLGFLVTAYIGAEASLDVTRVIKAKAEEKEK